MKENNFLEEYRKYLRQAANPERAKKEKAYLYSDLKHWGVSVWERRKWAREHKKEIMSWGKEKALGMVEKLWGSEYFEERAMGLGILNMYGKKLELSDMALIEKMMRESRGWAFLDSLIIPLMPGMIERDKRAYEYLKKWIVDDDFWVRRSALLAQLLFFRAGRGGDKELFFEMAESQLDESWIDELYEGGMRSRAKFFIRKAIGWTLREMSAKDPEAVVKFVKKNKERMSGLSVREATRKLPEEMRKKI